MQRTQLAQQGIITDPTSFAEYLTFTCLDGVDSDSLQDALAQVLGIEKSIAQKDRHANLSISIGISENGWASIFPHLPKPKQLHTFQGLKNGKREMPATAGDIFFMIKSERMDLNFQCAKYIRRAFLDKAELQEDTQGYKYLDSRDLIDFVDGTENPILHARLDTVLITDDIELHQGGSYLLVQKYVDRDNLRPWDSKTTEYQERVIGRTKMDDIELDDDVKPVWAHNNKSKVVVNDEEQRMFRQNRPFGNAQEHGTMFVGFSANLATLTTSITQMITADNEGHYDRLLDFVDAKTGCIYFCPSMTLLDTLGDD